MIVDETAGRIFVFSQITYNTIGYNVQVLDLASGRLLRIVPVPRGQPLGGYYTEAEMAVDERSNRVFVVIRVSDTAGLVLILQAITGRMMAMVRVGAGHHAVAVDEQTARVFVANYAAGTVSVHGVAGVSSKHESRRARKPSPPCSAHQVVSAV